MQRGKTFKPTGNPAKRPPKLKGRVANDLLVAALSCSAQLVLAAADRYAGTKPKEQRG